MKAGEVVVFMNAMANIFLRNALREIRCGGERLWGDQIFLNTSFGSVIQFSPIR